MKVIAHIKAFLKDEEGASGIEYALIAGMAALALTASSDTIRTNLEGIFTKVSGKLAGVNK
jgi:pilus assembly protein Flp/PilA